MRFAGRDDVIALRRGSCTLHGSGIIALDAGLHAAWVVRDDPVDAASAPRCWRGPDLLALADALGV